MQGGPRVYRRADVERVLRIKHLLFVEGLTLAGVRRKLQDEQPAAAPDSAGLEDLFSSAARERILSVRSALRELSAMLAQSPGAAPAEFALQAPATKTTRPRASAAAVKGRAPKKK